MKLGKFFLLGMTATALVSIRESCEAMDPRGQQDVQGSASAKGIVPQQPSDAGIDIHQRNMAKAQEAIEGFLPRIQALGQEDGIDPKVLEEMSKVQPLFEAATCEPEQKKELIRVTSRLVTEDMDLECCIGIVRALLDMSEQARQIFVRDVEQWELLNSSKYPPMSGEDRAEAIHGFARVSEEDRPIFSQLLQRFHIPPTMTGEDWASIVDSLSAIAKEEWEIFIEQANSLFVSGIKGQDWTSLVCSLTNFVDQGARGIFLKQIRLLFPREVMIGHVLGHFSSTVCVLSHFDEENRGIFLKQVLPILILDMTEFFRMVVLSCLENISDPTERQRLIDQANTLRTPNMTGDTYARFLSALGELSTTEERGEFLESARSLLIENMSDLDRVTIVDCLFTLQRGARGLRAVRALRDIDVPRDRPFDYTRRLREILELPLAAPLPPLGGGGYGAGVDVHHGDRDDLTRNALRQFWNQGGEMTAEETTLLYEEFLAFLETFKAASPGTYALAQRALSSKDPEGFGGLCVPEKVTAYGLTATGQEILARFWKFATQYPSEASRETLKSAIVGALEKSHDVTQIVGEEERYHVVCDEGKLQRLVVGVLQGWQKNDKGEEVRVDTLPPLKTADLLSAFFLEGGRAEIDSWPALRAEGEEVIKQTLARPPEERRGFNPEDFRGELLRYAQLQDLNDLPPSPVARDDQEEET